jgi:DNA-binding LytR/AlgR family response regulator
MNEKIILKKDQQITLVDELNVLSFQKEISQVKIVTSQDVFYSNKSLREIEETIGSSFYRLRNDAIINILRISKVDCLESKIILDNNQEFIIPKRKKKDLLRKMDSVCSFLN